MIVEFRELVEGLRRVAEPTRSSSGLTYKQVARHFLNEAVREFDDPARYFEVQFTPSCPADVRLPQLKGELFYAIRELLHPPQKAFSYGLISFSISDFTPLGFGESVYNPIQPEEFGLGTLGTPEDARIILTPPGFCESLKDGLVEIPTQEVGINLLRDPYPERLFRKIMEERLKWLTP